MRIPGFISAVLVALVLTACDDTADSPGSDTPASVSGSSTPSTAPTAPDPSATEAPRTEPQAYPFTKVDLRRLPVTRIGSEALPVGAPPQIPWSEPTPRLVYRIGDTVVPVPRGLGLSGVFAGQHVLTGGCTRPVARCGDKPLGGLHLLSPQGRLTRLDHEPGPHSLGNIVVNREGTRDGLGCRSSGPACRVPIERP